MKFTYTFFLFVLMLSTPAQENGFPQLNKVDYGKITRTEFYNGEELWGLINGGADVYLEYGMDKMLLQEVNVGENNYRIEIYGMNNADAAYGIYSINKFNCSKTDTITKFICITPYQVQAAVDRYYISISNENGKPGSEKYTLHLFDRLFKQINYRFYSIPEYFKKEHFSPYWEEIKLIKGPLGLQNGFVNWEKSFNEFSNYEITLMPVRIFDGYANLAFVKFSSKEEADRFIEKNRNNDKTFEVIETISPSELIFIETDLPQQQMKSFLSGNEF